MNPSPTPPPPIPPGEPTPVALFLMGPTASGKSALALELARHLPLEVINADAMQVYRGMAIGTAQPSPEERSQCPHHLFGVAEPDDPFSAGRFAREAWRLIHACRQRGTLPVLAGGTGLYFQAVERGLSQAPPSDPQRVAALRWEGEKVGWPAMHQHLAQVDPQLAARLPPNDAQRIVRGLAVWQGTGTPLSTWQQRQPPPPPLHLLKIAPHWPREELYRRIDHRYGEMMDRGLLEEARRLMERHLSPELPAMKAVGYRPLFAHLRGECSREEAVDAARQESRRYAKRQITWLRRETELVWLPGGEPGAPLPLVREFLRRVGVFA